MRILLLLVLAVSCLLLGAALGDEENTPLPTYPVLHFFDVVTQEYSASPIVPLTTVRGRTLGNCTVPDQIYASNVSGKMNQLTTALFADETSFVSYQQESLSTELGLEIDGVGLGFGFEVSSEEASFYTQKGYASFESFVQVIPHYTAGANVRVTENFAILSHWMKELPMDCADESDIEIYDRWIVGKTHIAVSFLFGQMLNVTISVSDEVIESWSEEETQDQFDLAFGAWKADVGMETKYSEDYYEDNLSESFKENAFYQSYWRGGSPVYNETNAYTSWVADVVDYSSNLFLPFCAQVEPLSVLLPLDVPESQVQCVEQAITRYWTSYGAAYDGPTHTLACSTISSQD